jgi:hypothetical protein
MAEGPQGPAATALLALASGSLKLLFFHSSHVPKHKVKSVFANYTHLAKS